MIVTDKVIDIDFYLLKNFADVYPNLVHLNVSNNGA